MVRPPASELSVLYVSDGWTPHDRRFLSAMARRLRHVAWLRLDGQATRKSDFPVPDGVRTIGLEPGDASRAVAAAARAAEAHLIHAGPLPTAARISIASGAAPVVAVAWGSDLLLADEAPATTRDTIRDVLSRAAGFVGDAHCVEASALAHGLPAATPRTIFPWGVEEAAFTHGGRRTEVRRSLRWEDAHVLISARAWKASYRLDVLLDAFDLALRADPALRLLLLGDGEDAPRVHARTETHLRSGRVVCPGTVAPEATRQFFEAADVYVSSVPSDGSSVSLLEAMAASLPAIGVDAYGNREWILPGVTGWRFPTADVAALAATIGEAFRVDLTRAAFGTEARRQVSLRARWELNVERLFRLYDAVALRT